MGSLPLEPQGQGLWSVYLPGDQHGRYYTFTVEVEGTQHETGDPYARTAGVNGLRSMILDAPRIDPPDWSHDHRPAIPASRRTVWELLTAQLQLCCSGSSASRTTAVSARLPQRH